MRILYVDLDSQRPDHLSCYGYHRQTSPNIDRIARQGVRFDNCYVSDAPCLPSRTALFSGRCGFHTGVVNHGGVAADPFIEGPGRQFHSTLGNTSWMASLRGAGLHTATVSPFGERHSAWHWYANFSEIHNTGKGGGESAEEVSPVVLDWVRHNATRDNWFLHVNFWDAHTPYRVPESFGNPFAAAPLPAWYTEEIRRQHWAGCGPHSAREVNGYGPADAAWLRQRYPQQPTEISSMTEARRMFDGYDCGVRYSDEHVGRILNALADQGVLDDTVVVITGDHGENLGELNIYGDHQLADHITTRVPLIVRWPGVTEKLAGQSQAGLLYHYDFAATLIELAGGKVPANWDGRSFAADLQSGRVAGRDELVVSQGAWSCQRGVRWGDHMLVRSYHDGYHDFPDVMLFNVRDDPHEQRDLAPAQPALVSEGLRRLEAWHAGMMRTATHPGDPMLTVLTEGGAYHTRGRLPEYLQRLRATGRGVAADSLAAKHPREAR